MALSIDLVQTGLGPGSGSMKADDFAVWLSAISGMSEGQRAAALAGPGKAASAAAAEAEASGKKAGERGRREDALGTAGVERVAAEGCPHCAGLEVVGWGRFGRAVAVPLQELRAHL
jgi:hypothetical protein